MSAPGIHHCMASSPLMKSQYQWWWRSSNQQNKQPPVYDVNICTITTVWRPGHTGTLASSSTARAPVFTVLCAWLESDTMEPTLAPPPAWTEERHQLNYKFSCCCANTKAAVVTAWRGRSVQNWFLTPAWLCSTVQQLGLFEELQAVTAWSDGRNWNWNTTTGWESWWR